MSLRVILRSLPYARNRINEAKILQPRPGKFALRTMKQYIKRIPYTLAGLDGEMVRWM